jgi:hypothetical protein
MAVENTKITPEKAMRELGIGKTRYYDLIEELGIKSHRVNGKAYITEEQMQKLRDYKQPQNAIAKIDESSDISFENIEEIKDRTEPQGEYQNDIFRDAQELLAQQLTMEDLIKLSLANQMTFEDLSEDLKLKVEQVRRMANPVGESKKIAAKILQEQRQLRQK